MRFPMSLIAVALLTAVLLAVPFTAPKSHAAPAPAPQLCNNDFCLDGWVDNGSFEMPIYCGSGGVGHRYYCASSGIAVVECDGYMVVIFTGPCDGGYSHRGRIVELGQDLRLMVIPAGDELYQKFHESFQHKGVSTKKTQKQLLKLERR